MLNGSLDSALQAWPRAIAFVGALVVSFAMPPSAHAQTQKVVYGYELRKNPSISIPKTTLLQIAEVNPMVAGMLVAFLPERRVPILNILQGSASSASRPTAATVILQLEGDPHDNATYGGTMLPLEKVGDALRTSWVSRLTEAGNLEVTFDTNLVDERGMLQRVASPGIRIEISNSTPSQLLAWRAVR